MRARRGAEISRGLLPPACFSPLEFTDRGSFSRSPNQTWSRAGRRNRRANWPPSIEQSISLTMARLRGGSEPNPLDAVSLPSSLVHLHLILPRFSDPGSYVVAVSKDRAGTAIVARGTGKTVGGGQRLLLDVSLDLRGCRGRIILPGHGARERQRHILLSSERAKPMMIGPTKGAHPVWIGHVA